MNILVTNDDGINAIGIKLLANKLIKYGNVYVVAPDKARSGASHSFTLSNLTLRKKNQIENTICYYCDGSPVDCVRIGLKALDINFDIVFSGINNGLNVGTDILYSGTVGAGREALIEGVPSIAISTDFDSVDIVTKELDSLLEYIFINKFYSTKYLLNVNFPIGKYNKSLGIAFARQGKKIFSTRFTQIEEGVYSQNDQDIFQDNNEDTDVYLVENGYTTITPLMLDQTDYKSLDKLINHKY